MVLPFRARVMFRCPSTTLSFLTVLLRRFVGIGASIIHPKNFLLICVGGIDEILP